MKKVIALFVFFLAFSQLGFSQENNVTDKLTSGKWLVKSMEIDGEKLELCKETSWMIFECNGTYKIALEEKEQLGTWKMLKNEIKFDSDNFDGESKIKKLTDKEFLFSISQGDVVYNMTLKR